MDGRLIRQLVLHEAADVALQRISRRGCGAINQDHVGVRAETMRGQSLQDVLRTVVIDRSKDLVLVEGPHERCQVEDDLNALERVLLLAEHLLLAGDVTTHVHELGPVLLSATLRQRAKGGGGAVHDVEADDALRASRREHRHQARADHALGAGHEAVGKRNRDGVFVDNAGLLSEFDTLLCSIPVVASLLQLLAPAGGVAHASQPFVLVVGGARSEEAVPPQERRCIVAVEELVMPVVLSSAAVAWNQMQQVEREVVARMGVISHEQAHVQPGPHERQVVGEKHARKEEAEAQDDRLDRVLVLRIRREWRLVGVVDLVNVLVDTPVVQSSVAEVDPSIVNDQREGETPSHVPKSWHGLEGVWNRKVLNEEILPSNERQLHEQLRGKDVDKDVVPLPHRRRSFVRLDLEALQLRRVLNHDGPHVEKERQCDVQERRAEHRNLQQTKVARHPTPS
mmetsp:Transcript_122168/g.390736  ORF Transcript_122168/g.390736 Transcript_122168/m.390736 type:complete len:454 (-) Transcript_122168:391-1752(-)